MKKQVLPGLLTAAIFGAAFLLRQSTSDEAAAQPKETNAPVAMALRLKGVLVELGLKDEGPTDWNGEISISAGIVLAIDVLPASPKVNVEGTKFNVKTTLAKKAKKDLVVRPSLRLTIDAPTSARVKITTNHGNFEFVLDDLPLEAPATFLKGQAAVTREGGSLRLTSGSGEYDYPALATGPDGTMWLASCAYQTGKPYLKERVLVGNFEDLEPQGNGDRLRLQHFDGAVWSAPLDVTDGGLRLWRPSVAVAAGKVHVSWSQQIDGDFEIFHRVYTPPAKGEAAGKWSETVRVTKHPGCDYNVVSTTAADGHVWLAWQSWEETHFQIVARRFDAKGVPVGAEVQLTKAKANHWNPAIAADSKGNVYVAYDDYEHENYDIRLARIDPKGDTRVFDVAASPRCEARATVAVDKDDRVWIAYEDGDEQWGKDYANEAFKKIGLKENPGNALYLKRTIQVKCLVGDVLMRPKGDLQEAIKVRTGRNRSLPRIAIDGAGLPWVFYRHHPKKQGIGEVWVSFASRYDCEQWSTPLQLAQSENLMDNRPAAAPFANAKGNGLVAVFSGDARVQQLNRKRNDLFAAVLGGAPMRRPMELLADNPPPAAALKMVHPNEAADVARIRDHRIEHNGKKLALFRGEFHRHTEYTAHRDGDGLLEDSWRYALDAASLDWMGNADHDNGHHDEYSWWQIQKMAELMHNPPHFVAVHSYERSNVYPNGHRNVILPRPGIRPLPGSLVGTEDKGTPDTKILYRYLKFFGGICSSHTSATGMGTDWRDNDPVYEPVVEIYQGHRHNYEQPGAPRSPTKATNLGGFEPKGFVSHALDKGYKLGFQSSSDHVSTHLSYGMVLTADLSRQGISDAFKRRHCYGATDNIVVEFRCGKHLMGDIFDVKGPPTFEVKVRGTAPIAKISLIRDGKFIHVAEPMKEDVAFTFTDQDAVAGKTSYYYVRVEQSDMNLAWASPMWITYQAK